MEWRADRAEIDQTTTLDRDIDETWGLVTDAASLGRWLGGEVEMRPHRGSPLEFRTSRRVQRGEVVDVSPGRRISWIWSDGIDESIVTIELEGDERSTVVRVTERLLPPRAWSRPSIPPVVGAVA